MAIIINVSSQLGKDLRTRSFFRNDIEEIIGNTTDECCLDFHDVIFISRSVADEIYNLLEDHKNLHISNMEGDVQKMYSIVKRGRTTPREYPSSEIKVIHLKTMKEMQEFFATF